MDVKIGSVDEISPETDLGGSGTEVGRPFSTESDVSEWVISCPPRIAAISLNLLY